MASETESNRTIRPTSWWAGLAFVLTAVLIVLADVVLWVIGGREATISRAVQSWGWSAHPIVMFASGAVCGGLVVHLLGWRP